MRITFVMLTTTLAGGMRYIFEVANRLESRGYSVKILSLLDDHGWFKGLNVEVIYKRPRYYNKADVAIFKLYKLYSLFKYGIDKARNIRPYEAFVSISRWMGVRPDFIYDLAELIQEFDQDVIIAASYQAALSAWLSSSPIRRLYLMQDFPELVEGDGAIGVKMFYLSLKLLAEFVAVSGYTKQIILEQNPTAKVTIAHPGVDHNVFRPRRGVVDVGGKKKIMVILRGLRHKGDEVAIRVLNEVSRRIPLHAILVGSKELVSKYSKSLGFNFSYSLFSGVDDDTLAKLYSSADAFLYTSYAEGFGLPPLEAMACGTPVVMTDNKGSRDYAVDGYNALISRPGDVESLAENLLRVLLDDKLRERLVENGLETSRRFTWDSTVEKFEEALKEEWTSSTRGLTSS